MENNDQDFSQARKWLYDIDNKVEYIESFSSKENFLKYKNLPIDSFPNREVMQEYIDGLGFINKVIMVRQVAAEAIIAKMLDENTYWLIRHGDFARDCNRLKRFMVSQYKNNNKSDAYDRRHFRMVVKKWEEAVISDVAYAHEKGDWSQYYENLK